MRTLTARQWGDIAVIIALSVLGVIGFRPPFGDFGFLLAGLGGLAVGAAAAIIAALTRLSALPTVLVAITGFFVLGTPFAVPELGVGVVIPTLDSLAALAIGSVFGWSDVLTLQTPIGAPAYIDVVPYTATWIVSFVSLTLAARWLPRHPRSMWRLALVLLGPVALYVASILIGTDEAYLPGLRGVGFAVLALVWIGWRHRPADAVEASTLTRLRRRKLTGTVVLLTGAVIAGYGVAVLATPPEDSRYVLRDEIEPPFDPLQYPSPLVGFRHYTKTVPDDVLFTVEGLQTGDRIRLATLDSYTGRLWNVTDSHASAAGGSGEFALVGSTMRAPDLLTVDHESAVTIEIREYSDVWVPGVGYAQSIEFIDGNAASTRDRLRYNESTGSAVLLGGLGEGDRYTLTSVVQATPTTDELRDVPVAMVELPPVYNSPDIITAKAGEFAGTATTPALILESIRRTLADTGFLSHGTASDAMPSRAGHGADRMELLLSRTQLIGDQEQYASAFALMARSLGYPARVVMGFAPEALPGQQSVEVTGSDVTAWVEVAFDGVGWVPYDPTPDETDIPQDEVPEPQTEPQPQVRQPPRVNDSDDSLLTPVEIDKVDNDDEEIFGLPGWVFGVAIGVLSIAALIFLPMLVVALIKARRRSRRKRGTEDARAAGAWDELVDGFSELGFDVPGKLTRTRTASALAAQLGEESNLAALADAADDAVFSGRAIDRDESTRLWSEAESLVSLARLSVSRGRRFLSRYRLRSSRDWALALTRTKESA